MNLTISEIASQLLIAPLIFAISSPLLKILKKKNIAEHSIIINAICGFTSLCFLLFAHIFCKKYFISSARIADPSQPIIYRISNSWSSYEGSLLLMTSIIGLSGLSIIYKKDNFEIRSLSSTIHSFFFLCFDLLLLVKANPFAPAKDVQKSINPLLQDSSLLVHPPVTYIGIALSLCLFSNLVASLIKKENPKTRTQSLRKLSFICWFFSTIGITLGGEWAYGEMGWGGFWFWDPIENASLIPWLLIGGACHAATRKEKSHLLFALLGTASFVSGVMGFFAARSGLVDSVHAFAADKEQALISLFILSIASIIGSLAIILAPDFNTPSKQTISITKMSSILFGITAILIANGFIAPMTAKSLGIEKSFVFGEKYFKKVFSPCVIIGLILCSIHYLKNRKISLCRLTASIAIGIVTVLVIKFSEDISYTSRNLVICSGILLAIIVALASFSAATISHMGFAIVTLSVVLSQGMIDEASFTLDKGNSIKIGNFSITYLTSASSNMGYYDSIFFILETKKGEKSVFLKPEVRVYRIDGSIASKPSIKRINLYDVNASIENSNSEEKIRINLSIRPTALFLWIGAIMIMFGSLMAATNLYLLTTKRSLSRIHV